MSDGIFGGIFPIVHRIFLLSYFRGCWLLDFSCAQSMWTYNEAAIELAAAVFIARNSGHFAPVINCQRNLISKMADKNDRSQGKRIPCDR